MTSPAPGRHVRGCRLHHSRIDRAIGRIPSRGKRFIQPLGKTSCCSHAAFPDAAAGSRADQG